MKKRMSLGSRRELLETTAERYRFERYRFATKKQKGKRRRRRRYDKQVGQALIRLWKAANRICSKPACSAKISRESLLKHGTRLTQ